MNTWMDTREKVFAYIKEHQMLQPGDRVVAGVSGGADSVCLLFLLLEWRREFPLDIAVVHVNQGSGRKPVRMPGMWKNCVENIESRFS